MVIVVAATGALGRWQLNRGQEKEALQAHHEAAVAAPPIALDAAVRDIRAVEYRRVIARGEFLPASTIYLDNRTHGGVPGFEVITALKLGEGIAVPVVRGWVAASAQKLRTPPSVATPAGSIEIAGRAVAQPGHFLTLAGAADNRLGGPWPNFAFDDYARQTQLAMQPFVVLQTSQADDGLIRDWPQPGSGASKHWSYAAQWFGMAIAAFVWWIWFGLRRIGARAQE